MKISFSTVPLWSSRPLRVTAPIGPVNDRAASTSGSVKATDDGKVRVSERTTDRCRLPSSIWAATAGDGLATTRSGGVEALGRKKPSPAYSALIVRGPAASVVTNVVEPPLRMIVPGVEVPSLMVTVPVGVPLGEETVSETVTLWPTVGVLGLAVTAVLVENC